MRKIIDAQTILFALSVVAVWAVIVLISGTGTNFFPYDWNFENTGQFGDSFGSLSAIMAALAALAALSTLRATQSEIARVTQKDEDAGEHQERLQGHLQKREKLEDKRLEKAEFERTFFQLLSFFNQIVSETDIVNQNKQHPQKGKDAFKAIFDSFNRTKMMNELDDNRAYDRIVNQYQNDLNHYFRFLYHIIKYVDSRKDIDRYFYVRLVRATLSEAETALLALNCAYGEGKEKFKMLTEKYALFHNLSPDLRARLNLDGLFENGAFIYLASK